MFKPKHSIDSESSLLSLGSSIFDKNLTPARKYDISKYGTSKTSKLDIYFGFSSKQTPSIKSQRTNAKSFFTSGGLKSIKTSNLYTGSIETFKTLETQKSSYVIEHQKTKLSLRSIYSEIKRSKSQSTILNSKPSKSARSISKSSKKLNYSQILKKSLPVDYLNSNSQRYTPYRKPFFKKKKKGLPPNIAVKEDNKSSRKWFSVKSKVIKLVKDKQKALKIAKSLISHLEELHFFMHSSIKFKKMITFLTNRAFPADKIILMFLLGTKNNEYPKNMTVRNVIEYLRCQPTNLLKMNSSYNSIFKSRKQLTQNNSFRYVISSSFLPSIILHPFLNNIFNPLLSRNLRSLSQLPPLRQKNIIENLRNIEDKKPQTENQFIHELMRTRVAFKLDPKQYSTISYIITLIRNYLEEAYKNENKRFRDITSDKFEEIDRLNEWKLRHEVQQRFCIIKYLKHQEDLKRKQEEKINDKVEREFSQQDIISKMSELELKNIKFETDRSVRKKNQFMRKKAYLVHEFHRERLQE